MRSFDSLTEQETLALAISLEEEDARIYDDFTELGVIAWVRRRFMDTPRSSAVLQVVLGGILVFLAGVLIGKS
jgi:hypothetical protein